MWTTENCFPQLRQTTTCPVSSTFVMSAGPDQVIVGIVTSSSLSDLTLPRESIPDSQPSIPDLTPCCHTHAADAQGLVVAQLVHVSRLPSAHPGAPLCSECVLLPPVPAVPQVPARHHHVLSDPCACLPLAL